MGWWERICSKSAACCLKQNSAFEKSSCLLPPQHTEPRSGHRSWAAHRGSPPAPRCGDRESRNTEHGHVGQESLVLRQVAQRADVVRNLTRRDVTGKHWLAVPALLGEGAHPALKSWGPRAWFSRRAQADAGSQPARQPARTRSRLWQRRRLLTSQQVPGNATVSLADELFTYLRLIYLSLSSEILQHNVNSSFRAITTMDYHISRLH